MLATRTATGLDMFRPPVIRIHELPVVPTAPRQLYAPALSFPQHVTVQESIDALRKMNPVNDSIYYLFVTDYEEHLVGVVSLRQLIVSSPGTRLFEIMDRRSITLPPDASLAEQATLMHETGLMALPVVDEEGRLVGAVDTNDLISAVKDETTEEMYRLAGVCKDESIDRPWFHAATSRVTSLMVNLLSVVLLAWIISRFDTTIAHVAILAAFIPIVIGQSKNASFQTLTVMINSFLSGKITKSNTRKMFNREIFIGIVNGLCIGLLVGIFGWLWQGSVMLGVVAGVSTLGALFVAALMGVIVPVLLKMMHFNPSRWAAMLVTTSTHACALAFFLGIGTLAEQLGYL